MVQLQNKCLFHSSNGRGPRPHRLTDFKKPGCRISSLERRMSIGTRAHAVRPVNFKDMGREEVVLTGTGSPWSPRKLVPEKWQYVWVNLHPEDLNERVSESVRVSPTVRWGIWSRMHSWVHMPFTLTSYLSRTAHSWLHFRSLYCHHVWDTAHSHPSVIYQSCRSSQLQWPQKVFGRTKFLRR